MESRTGSVTAVFQGRFMTKISTDVLNVSRSGVSTLVGGAVLAAIFVLPLQAADTTAETDSEGQQLQEVVVTGSFIPRTDKETPSPVQVVSEEDIKQSGYTTVSD